MIYYVPLLMIDDFEYSIIEKFDKLLQYFAKSKNKKLTPWYVSNKLNIPELSATKLLSQSEKVGLVKLEYITKCVGCGKEIKFRKLNVTNRALCESCRIAEKKLNIKDIYFYYLVIVK